MSLVRVVAHLVPLQVLQGTGRLTVHHHESRQKGLLVV